MGRKSTQSSSKFVSSGALEEIENCMVADRNILKRRLAKLHKDNEKYNRRFLQQLERAKSRKQHRLSACPAVQFTNTLPIHDKLDEITDAINGNQVVVVCGETGSGKTTQLAKLCLGIGRGINGFIGHTQPRRLAARAVAARIAEELGVSGDAVAYKIRHSDQTSLGTYIKVMTDGILLAELQQDRWLERYDTLIIDEAHERSLNIDFLLGYLKQFLPKRPDLKVIVTSATIDVKSFSEFFNHAPIIEVSGRTFPVEVLYRPAEGLEDYDTDTEHFTLLSAVKEVSAYGPGDVLIFLEGEREIHETTRFLQKQNLPDTDVLPLYSRLSSSRQSAIFKSHKRRHIILATNVAETSLTIPGIRYVIDRGFARISRYSRRNKVQQLPVEKISRASAEQRKGRCGRVAEGLCLRLYSEEDFESRPEFTDPEIVRTNLASVILQMKTLKLGDIHEFPFLQAPDSRYINDGLRLLTEIKALDKNGHLTKEGRVIARLPVDPRLGAVLVAAGEYSCVRELLTIASALSIQDPRERPLDAQEKADAAHAKFADERSDFLSFINFWNFYHEHAKTLSRNQLRKLCQQNFISYVRMREWKEVRKQLAEQLRDLGINENQEKADYEPVHHALIKGFLGNIAVKTTATEYTGARGLTIHIFPGSEQFTRLPKWILASELVETSRLYARNVASINPRWLIKPASHISKSEYYEPHWDNKAQQVLVYEQISLYGLVIASGHKVNYSRINAAECRKIFIREALLGELLTGNLPFMQHNRSVLNEIEMLEKKSRRHDILDEQSLFEFYECNIPAEIIDGHAFRSWYLKERRNNKKLLCIEPEQVMYHQATDITANDFPDNVRLANSVLGVEYEFKPSAANDGASIDIPIYQLNQIHEERLDRLVPGMTYEKILFLLKSLPKNIRRQLVPIPDAATDCEKAIKTGSRELKKDLSAYLFRSKGIMISDDVWSGVEYPDHLRVNIRVIDDNSNIIKQGRDLSVLQKDLKSKLEMKFRNLPEQDIEREGIDTWDFDDLPESCDVKINDSTLKMYPAIMDDEVSVSIRLFENKNQAIQETCYGLNRLFRIAAKKEFKYLEKNLPHLKEMIFYYSSIGTRESLLDSLLYLVSAEVFLGKERVIRKKTDFNATLESGKSRLVSVANDIAKLIFNILHKYHCIISNLNKPEYQSFEDVTEEIESQLYHLVYAGFLEEIALADLRQYPRYLDAISRRLEKLSLSPAKDRSLAEKIAPFWNFYLDSVESGAWDGINDQPLQQYKRMLEEYRVSLFAQELGTEISVSPVKLNKQIEIIRSGNPVFTDKFNA